MEATPLHRLWFRRRNETVRTAIRDRQTKIGQGTRRSLAAKAIELTSQSDADVNALLWALRYIDEDDELQAFLNGLPGLHHLTGLREGMEELVKPLTFKPFPTTGFLTEGIDNVSRPISELFGASQVPSIAILGRSGSSGTR